MAVGGDKGVSISIVLATFNGEKFINDQLESLINQTDQPHEIIISDDNSTDSTVSIVEGFSRRTKVPVRLLKNDAALGYADNFLTAAEHATGDFIAFCDQDDVWLPDKIHRLKTLAATYGDDITLIVHKGRVIDNAGRPTGAYHPDIKHFHVADAFSGSLFARPPGFAMCFRRSLLTDFPWRARPLDLHFASSQTKHDSWIVTVAAVAGRIVWDSEILVNYRRHGSNHSHFRRGNQLVRRLGQIRDSLSPRTHASLRVELCGLRSHQAYFQGFVGTKLEHAAKRAADRYDAAANRVESRLRMLGASFLGRLMLIADGVRSGSYLSEGRLLRRSLAQDVAILFASNR